MLYFDIHLAANMELISVGRIKHSTSVFNSILSGISCLHSFLPPECYSEVF